MAKQPNATAPSEADLMRKRAKEELSEGDLAEIFLKDNAVIDDGVYYGIVLDPSGRDSHPGKSCGGYIGFIGLDSLSLRDVWNISDNKLGRDVPYEAMKDFVNYSRR